MIIYGSLVSPFVRKVLAYLGEKGIDFELKGVGIGDPDPGFQAASPLGKMPGFLVAGEGAVWVQEQGDGTVAKVDPAALTITGRTKVGDNLKWGDIDANGGAVWLRTTDDQTMVVIDPVTLKIRARMGDAVGSGALRWTPKGVWTSAHDNQTLSWWSAPTP